MPPCADKVQWSFIRVAKITHEQYQAAYTKYYMHKLLMFLSITKMDDLYLLQCKYHQ